MENDKIKALVDIAKGEIASAAQEFATVKNKQLLLDGVNFLKYGSWGKPAMRTIYLSKDFKLLEWKHLDEDKPSGFIAVKTIRGIKLGRTTERFKRNPPKTPEQERLSFTIISDRRDLDLEASTKEQMEDFIEGLASLMQHKKRKGSKEVDLRTLRSLGSFGV